MEEMEEMEEMEDIRHGMNLLHHLGPPPSCAPTSSFAPTSPSYAPTSPSAHSNDASDEEPVQALYQAHKSMYSHRCSDDTQT